MSEPRDVEALVASDHERIWLQNADDAKHQDVGRLWCEDKVWPDDPEDGEPTGYVRADLFASERSRADRLEKALTEIAWSDDVENALDPARNKRIARAALSADGGSRG